MVHTVYWYNVDHPNSPFTINPIKNIDLAAKIAFRRQELWPLVIEMGWFGSYEVEIYDVSEEGVITHIDTRVPSGLFYQGDDG